MLQEWLEISSWKAILTALMKTDENSLAAQVAAKLNLRMEWQLLGKLLFLIFAMTQSESNSLSTDLRLVSRICI